MIARRLSSEDVVDAAPVVGRRLMISLLRNIRINPPGSVDVFGYVFHCRILETTFRTGSGLGFRAGLIFGGLVSC